jgi:clan AA aspartic protease
MISGSVLHRQAEVGIVLRVPGQQNLTIEFVVDTGFAGSLTLPPAAVTTLGLPFFQRTVAGLADDSAIEVDSHTATIVWNGKERDVDVLATGRRPLVGTSLLDGHELVVQFTDGGLVTIDDL